MKIVLQTLAMPFFSYCSRKKRHSKCLYLRLSAHETEEYNFYITLYYVSEAKTGWLWEG